MQWIWQVCLGHALGAGSHELGMMMIVSSFSLNIGPGNSSESCCFITDLLGVA